MKMLDHLLHCRFFLSTIVPELTDLPLQGACSMTRQALDRLTNGVTSLDKLRSIALLTCNVVISGKARQRRTMRLRTIHPAKADKSEGSPTRPIIIASNCLL